MKKQKIKAMFTVAIIAISLSALFGETVVWNGNKSSDYNDFANWSTNKVPSIDDHVVIVADAVNNPVMQQSNKCTSLDIKGGASLTIDAVKAKKMIILEFKDVKGCGFKTNKDSKGTLICVGDKENRIFLTSTAENKPRNHWKFGVVSGFKVKACYTSFYYSDLPIYKAQVNLEHCDFAHAKGYQFSLYNVNQLKKMDDCTLRNGPGGIYADSHKTIKNMVIKESVDKYNQVITRGGKLEFLNSSFNERKVGHMGSKRGLIISKNHNDIENDYKIFIHHEWKYSSIKNKFSAKDNVYVKATYRKDKGTLVIDEDAECNDLTIAKGTVLVINEGVVLTVNGELTKNGSVTSNGKLICPER